MNPPPDSDPADVLLQQAKLLLEANRTKQAVPLLLQAASLAPDDARVLCHLSYAFSGLGDTKNALRYAEDALSHDPNNEWAHRLRGHVFWTRNKLKEALSCAREAQSVAPDEPQVYRMQADLLMVQRKWNEAEAAAHQMRTLAPELPQPYLLLAQITLDRTLAGKNKHKTAAKAHREAEAWARQALSLAPDLSQAHTVLGQSLRAQHKTAEALEAFYQASLLDPTEKTVRQNLTDTVFARFFAAPVFLLTALLLPLQAIFWHFGGLGAAGMGGLAVSSLSAWFLVRQFAPRIAQNQKRFRVLPGNQRDTLLGLMRAHHSPLPGTAAFLSGAFAVLPMVFVLFWGVRYPKEGRAIIRTLDKVFKVAPPRPASLGGMRVVGAFRITAQSVEVLPAAKMPPSAQTEGLPVYTPPSPWWKSAGPDTKIVAVRVLVENTENQTFAPPFFAARLLNVQNQQISQNRLDSRNNPVRPFSEKQTEATWSHWNPHEKKAGWLFFAVGKNDAPSRLVLQNTTEADEAAAWRLVP